jgi:hypothetical protein
MKYEYSTIVKPYMSEALNDLNKLGDRGFKVINVHYHSQTNSYVILLMKEIPPAMDC